MADLTRLNTLHMCTSGSWNCVESTELGIATNQLVCFSLAIEMKSGFRPPPAFSPKRFLRKHGSSCLQPNRSTFGGSHSWLSRGRQFGASEGWLRVLSKVLLQHRLLLMKRRRAICVVSLSHLFRRKEHPWWLTKVDVIDLTYMEHDRYSTKSYGPLVESKRKLFILPQGLTKRIRTKSNRRNPR